MRKLYILLAVLLVGSAANAQLFKSKKDTSSTKVVKTSTPKPPKAPKVKPDFSKINLSNRTADHVLIQFGSDSWVNRPDSVRTGNGFSRHFNFYIMMDKPFKTNPHFSAAYGIGIGSSNIFFDKTYVNLKGTGSRLPFTDVSQTNHFDKFKLTTIYLELPVEIRYYSNPENPAKSWKFAVGAKVGTLLKSYTKGKNWVDRNGNTIFGPTYIQKESNKRFINGTRLAVTGRVGYGNLSLHGGFTITPITKAGLGPDMNNFSLGLTLSGL